MLSEAAYLTNVLAQFEARGSDDDSNVTASINENTLLDRIRTGDTAAFEELVLTLSRPLEGYARRFTATPDAAKDIVQDVLAHLWEHRSTLRVRGSLRSYLYGMVRNRALDVRRHDQSEAMRLADLDVSGVPPGMSSGFADPDAEVERKEIAARLAAALDALSSRAREVALLRWAHGLSRSDIAAIMGIAVPTVNNQLTIAARAVRALLADLRGRA